MDENSGEFSDELDEFEESIEDAKPKNFRNHTSYSNKPYDEGEDVSQDLSMAESFDGREKFEKERKLKNDKYDEAVEVSQSIDQSHMSAAPKPMNHALGMGSAKDEKNVEAKGSLIKGNEQSKSQSVLNKPFDEALEFSRSGSDESVDTRGSLNKGTAPSQKQPDMKQATAMQQMQQPISNTEPVSIPDQKDAPRVERSPKKHHSPQKDGDDDESSEEEADHEESYDNLEGAYNPKDYAQLNVSVEVRDLFQYIERYKPSEVQLDAPLRCFIPEYIPAIGELDAFIKVPRPDNKEDGLGLRYLDEPSSNQSDPTVLELQLRAKSKKLQYGDVAVRSIEHADKNPQKIEKWIQDISDLHSSKPPPQVNYKKNMPDIEKLLDVWPEEFETFLETAQLPSPELDLSLAEYAKTLCSILDIPTYDNPIESLHMLFSIYVDFRNNPHFQARLLNGQADAKDGPDPVRNERNNYGNADVLEIGQDYK